MFINFNQNISQVTGIENNSQGIQIWVRGYIIREDKLFLENECISFIFDDYLGGLFIKNVPKYNGCWQIVIYDSNQQKVIVANDRWGSYPLFKTEHNGQLYISDNWKEILPYSHKKMNKQATIEMVSFGYVMENKTLIDGIDDFPPHAIMEHDFENGKSRVKTTDYWHLSYQFSPANEKEKEKEFANLWQSQLKIYADAIKSKSNACYIPVSGGLDSRILAAEFDKHRIDIFAMTFGSYKGYDEIDSALQVVSELRQSAGHFIQYLNQRTLEKLAESPNYCNRITSSYFGQLYLDYFCQLKDKSEFIIPGFSGDFMGGSLIRYRMLKWKSNNDAIKYILEQRSAPMVKAFYADERYRENILTAVKKHFPNDDDVISNYVRWFTENDIRRYLIRSVINEGNPHGHLLLPFFDYKLMDFFLELPVHLLINKRLYTNTQIKYLYRDHKELLKIKRSRPSGKIRPVGNAFISEYGNKLKNKFNLIFKSSQGKSQWDNDIDWYKIYGDMVLPEFLDKNLLRHPNLLNKPNYIKYFDTVSRVYEEIKSC